MDFLKKAFAISLISLGLVVSGYFMGRHTAMAQTGGVGRFQPLGSGLALDTKTGKTCDPQATPSVKPPAGFNLDARGILVCDLIDSK